MSDPVLIAALVSIPSTVAAIATLVVAIKAVRKVESVHTSINSRMDKLLELTGSEAHAAGVQEEKDRQAAS